MVASLLPRVHETTATAAARRAAFAVALKANRRARCYKYWLLPTAMVPNAHSDPDSETPEHSHAGGGDAARPWRCHVGHQ